MLTLQGEWHIVLYIGATWQTLYHLRNFSLW